MLVEGKQEMDCLWGLYHVQKLLAANELLQVLQSTLVPASAVNLILKSKPVNWKAITGSYWLTGFCVQVQHLSLIMSVLTLMYVQVLLKYTEYLKLKIKVIFEMKFPISFRCFKYEKCHDLDNFQPHFVYF